MTLLSYRIISLSSDWYKSYHFLYLFFSSAVQRDRKVNEFADNEYRTNLYTEKK